jgi:hypothetical protein
LKKLHLSSKLLTLAVAGARDLGIQGSPHNQHSVANDVVIVNLNGAKRRAARMLVHL